MNRWKILGFVTVVVVGSLIFRDKFNTKIKVAKDDNLLVLPRLIDKKIKVAIMADIHGDGEQLEKMLLKAINDEVNLVIIAGDLTKNGKNDELLNIKNLLVRSKLKYAVIPGDRERNLDEFRKHFGQDYHTIEIGNIKFILINNSSWHGLGEEQKRWIEKEIVVCRQKICIGVMHKALNNLFSTQIMGEGNKKVEAEALWLKQLFVDSGVRRIEAGDLHYATSYELEGIRTDIVGAISREDNLQSPRYTELMISDNLIERRVVEGKNDTGN